ncbi:hypothetical protein HRR90_001561 [Exophiala dermatitidis]|nr:hypothetical protein HRR74_003833 [Exophiala dermatitidis]KAJ4618007.1 hypothetical protein HRR88_007088 [Exophiala dermatitidis]KAJ4644053.1 hypothetical protein HRR89_003089 [Exophiala dermatitidis]KAJ4651561.1 hypothetical protein HRR91_005389 [Exophiala dermatitidis]KAJ4659884.1 hypothetical protein HRR90_001561 [Exophiala dermatitidis]
MEQETSPIRSRGTGLDAGGGLEPRTTESSTATATATATGTFTLLLFASASTYANNVETMVLPAPTTLRSVFCGLETRFPGFTEKVLKSSAVTVNLEYVDSLDLADLDVQRDLRLIGGRDDGRDRREDGKDQEGSGAGLDMVISPGDEVGIIPPVSSG